MAKKDKTERRDRLRIPLNSQIELRPQRGIGVQTGQVRNLTANGILFETLHGLAPGELYDFLIQPLPSDSSEASPIRGTLRIQRAEGSEPPFEVAAVILEVSMG